MCSTASCSRRWCWPGQPGESGGSAAAGQRPPQHPRGCPERARSFPSNRRRLNGHDPKAIRRNRQVAPAPPAAAWMPISVGDPSGSKGRSRRDGELVALLGRLILFVALTGGTSRLDPRPAARPHDERGGPVAVYGARPATKPHPLRRSAGLRHAAGVSPAVGCVGGSTATPFTSTVSDTRCSPDSPCWPWFFSGCGKAMPGAGAAPRIGARVWPGPWPLVALAFFVLSLGPVLHIGGRTPNCSRGGGDSRCRMAWLVAIVPFMEISRSVSRMDVMVMLALGVAGRHGARAWLDRSWPGSRGQAAPVVLLGFGHLRVPAGPLPDGPARHPRTGIGPSGRSATRRRAEPANELGSPRLSALSDGAPKAADRRLHQPG